MLTVIITAGIAVPAAFWFGYVLGIVAAGFFSAILVFSLFFFREPGPARAFANTSAVYAPAYGHILSIEDGDKQKIIRIFLSVFDVHVQYMPLAGIIRGIRYHPGAFNMAFDKNAADNERNRLEIATADGRYISVEQIAGFIARRISCTVNTGDAIDGRQRIGMIRFGSQVAVYLPEDVSLAVRKGQFVTPEQVLAEFKKQGDN